MTVRKIVKGLVAWFVINVVMTAVIIPVGFMWAVLVTAAGMPAQAAVVIVFVAWIAWLVISFVTLDWNYDD